MDKRAERVKLLNRLRKEFEAVGREDVTAMSQPQFYRFILKQERLERNEFFAEPRTPVEFMGELAFSISRANARQNAYASGDPNWNR